MKSENVSTKDTLELLKKSTSNIKKGDAQDLGKLEVKKSANESKEIKSGKATVLPSQELIKSKDALDTINKSLDTIEHITKSYTELVGNLVKGVKVPEDKEIEKSEEVEKGDQPDGKKKVAKEAKNAKDYEDKEDPEDKGKDEKDKAEKSKKSEEDLNKSFEEDKEHTSKSAAIEDESLAGDISELVDTIDKSVEIMQEGDSRIKELTTLKKSVKESENIDRDTLNKFVEKYNEI